MSFGALLAYVAAREGMFYIAIFNVDASLDLILTLLTKPWLISSRFSGSHEWYYLRKKTKCSEQRCTSKI